MRIVDVLSVTGLLLFAAPVAVAAQSEPMLVTSTLRGPIAYHVVGDAPGTPIVLINGGPGYDHQYLHLSPAWERLGAHRRVVFFDQPGTGHSYDVGSGDTVSVQDLLDAISAIQSALGADSLALLGHSWGGYVAMAFAVRHPERTEGIILVGTAAPNWTDTEFNFGPLFPDSLARGASEPSDPDGARKDLRRHLAMSFYSPATRQIVLNGFAGLPRNARQAELLVADASANDLWTPIGTLRMPVLVGTGRFDANVAPRTSWRVHEAIPMSKFVVWERSGHYPMIEEPDAFVEVILRFLSDPSRP